MRPTASEQQLVRVGRISAGVMVFLGLAWIPLMKFVNSQIYLYLQSVQAYIAPPIAACFLLGLFFRRLNGTGAMASLVTGLVLGVLRLVLELTNKATGGGLEPGTPWHWIATINFLHYAVLLFVICTVVLFVVSMLTPPPPATKPTASRTSAPHQAPPPCCWKARPRKIGDSKLGCRCSSWPSLGCCGSCSVEKPVRGERCAVRGTARSRGRVPPIRPAAQPPIGIRSAHDIGSLFSDVQLAGIFPDSKEFVDARPRSAPAAIEARYDSARRTTGFVLRAFVDQNFVLPRPAGDGYHTVASQGMVEHIDALWQVLTRQADSADARSSLIPLPSPYVVPGGRFREVYYWIPTSRCRAWCGAAVPTS